MNCSICGREFGSGTNCQHCGIDRVSGLANYSSYNNPEGGNSYDSSNNGGHTSSKTTVCYACNEIIPVGSTFCPVCGKKLSVVCPNCGHEYSSQYPVCNKCGTNREEYNKRKKREEEERQRKQREWEQSPEGKAEFARKKEEQKRQEEEKQANLIIFLIMVPIWSAFWYAGIKKGIPGLIQIPEVWPNTFPTDIIMCLILGIITQYIYYIFNSDK